MPPIHLQKSTMPGINRLTAMREVGGEEVLFYSYVNLHRYQLPEWRSLEVTNATYWNQYHQISIHYQWYQAAVSYICYEYRTFLSISIGHRQIPLRPHADHLQYTFHTRGTWKGSHERRPRTFRGLLLVSRPLYTCLLQFISWYTLVIEIRRKW